MTFLGIDRTLHPSLDEINFLQAGTGAVQRDAQSKMRDIISSEDFGGAEIGTLTLNVPSEYATVQAAFDYLAPLTIAAGTTIQIKVADGTLTLSSGINCNHPQGSQIELVGNTSTPSNCVIRGPNPPTFDAITVSDGHILGRLAGFKIDIATKATSSNPYTAVLAENGSSIICDDTTIVVDNWYYGIAARNGASIRCRGAVVSNAGDVGIWAFAGSSVDCRSATVSAVSDASASLGFGIQGEYGSSVDCESASATTCKIGGIAALSGSAVRALSATSSSNTGSGFFARDGGTIEAHSATASSNTRYGIEELTNGTVFYNSITLSSNALGGTAPTARLNTDTALGARLDSSSGDLRIDTTGANNIFFNTSGGPQGAFEHAANSVNYIRLKGAGTTASPSLTAYSATDTNVDASVRGQGTGSVFLGNQLSNYLRVNPSASGTPTLAAEGATNLDIGVRAKGTGSVFLGLNQANYVRINSGTTGNSPQVIPEGETNLDLRLDGKGTGLVRFGVKTGTGDTATDGYVTIKDSAGNTIKLATVA